MGHIVPQESPGPGRVDPDPRIQLAALLHLKGGLHECGPRHVTSLLARSTFQLINMPPRPPPADGSLGVVALLSVGFAATEVEQRAIRGAARHQQAGLPWRGQGQIRLPTDPSVESEPGDDTECSLVRWESRNSLRRPRRGRGWAPEARTAEDGVLLDRLPHGLRSRPQCRAVPTDWVRMGGERSRSRTRS
jgi:hypothetical protein